MVQRYDSARMALDVRRARQTRGSPLRFTRWDLDSTAGQTAQMSPTASPTDWPHAASGGLAWRGGFSYACREIPLGWPVQDDALTTPR